MTVVKKSCVWPECYPQFFFCLPWFLSAGRGSLKSSKSQSQGPVDLVDRGQQESGGQVAGKTRLSIPSPSPCLFTPKTSVFLRRLDTHAQASQHFFICFKDITTRSMANFRKCYQNNFRKNVLSRTGIQGI